MKLLKEHLHHFIFGAIFLACLFIMAGSAYGQIWKKSAASDSGGLFGNSGNQTNINIGEAEAEKSAGDSELVNESLWNVDLEGVGFLIPDQATKRFVTGPISLGTTYKFSEHFHLVYKYVKFEFDGNADTEWDMEAHLIGGGFRKFFNRNTMQFVASFGSGSSTLKEKSGQVKVPEYEAPIWADITFNYVIDNFSFGPRFGYMMVDTKEDHPRPTKGGGSFIGFAFQFGIPDTK